MEPCKYWISEVLATDEDREEDEANRLRVEMEDEEARKAAHG